MKRDTLQRATAIILSASMTLSSVPMNVVALGEVETETQNLEDMDEDILISEHSESETDAVIGNDQDDDPSLEDETYVDDLEETAVSARTADAVFTIVWGDESDLSQRRKDLKASDFLTVYADNQYMNDQPEIHLDQGKDNNPYEKNGLQCYQYRISNLPVTQEDGTPITYQVKEEKDQLLAAYTDLNVDAIMGAEEAEAIKKLAHFAGPHTDDGITLVYVEDEEEFHAEDTDGIEMQFGNYLPAYETAGTVTWNLADAQQPTSDMESWFANQFRILDANGEIYQSYRLHYEQDAENPNQWNFSVKGLFTTTADNHPTEYTIQIGDTDSYTTTIQGAEISSSNTNIQIMMTSKEETEQQPETDTPSEIIPDEAKPAEEPAEEEPEEEIQVQPSFIEQITGMNAQELLDFLTEKKQENPDWIAELTAEELTALMETAMNTGVFDLILDAWGSDDYDALMEAIEERADTLGILGEIAEMYRGEAMLLDVGDDSLNRPEANPDDSEGKPEVLIKTVISEEISETITYQVKKSSGDVYTGGYVVIAPGETADGNTQQVGEDGKITLKVSDKGTYTIKLLDAADTETYTVTADGDSRELSKLYLMSDLEQNNISKTKNAEFDYSTYTENPVVLTKTWNDGRANHPDDFQMHFLNKHLKLICLVDNQEKTDVPVDFSNAETKVTGSVVTFTTDKLPEFYFDSGKKEWSKITYQFEEDLNCDDTNCVINTGNYITEYRNADGTGNSDKNALMNTLKVNTDESNLDYFANVTWKDKGQTTCRPDDTAYINSLKIYRYTGTNEGTEVTFSNGDTIADHIILSGSNTDQWNVSLADLPKYDENGEPYSYYIVETKDAENKLYKNDDFYYDNKYVNTGAYGLKTDALYNGGTVTNTRMEYTDFTFCLEWIDGNCTWYEDNTLYLYRFAIDGGGSEETASPVQGFDKMYFRDGVLYAKVDGQEEAINYTEKTIDGKTYHQYTYTGTVSNSRLEKCSAEGAEYTYFIKQKDLGNPDYTTTITKSDGTTSNYLYNKGTLINQLTQNLPVAATKTWNAKEMSGALENLKVTIQLKKRYVRKTLVGGVETKTYTDWENAKDTDNNDLSVTIGDNPKFSAEIYTLSKSFPDQLKYTTEVVNDLPIGTEIEYKIEETNVAYTGTSTGDHTVTMDGDIIKIPGVGPGGTDAVFRRSYSEDGRTVTNTIISETQVKVTKNWSGSTTWPDGATVTAKLYREGSPTVKDLFGNQLTDEQRTITLSETSQTGLFENLPRFDENGKEISYYIKEVALANAGQYEFDSVDYTTSYPENVAINISETETTLGKIQETDAQINNVLPGTGSPYIRVSKQWLDDGDETHRKDVLVGIFRKADIDEGSAFTTDTNKTVLNTEKCLGQQTLSNGNAWTQRVYFDDITSGTINISDYVALEISINGKMIEYTNNSNPPYSVNSILGINNNQIVNITGDVKADYHLYHVYTTTGTTLGESGYIIYNQRYGDVTLQLDKTWKNGGKHLDGSFFRVTRTVAGNSEDVAVHDTITRPDNLANTDTEKVADMNTTLGASNVFYLPYGDGGKSSWELLNQEKYDAYGRMYTYTVEEFAVVDENGKVWWKGADGNATVFLDNITENPSTMSEATKNSYKYDTYQCAMITNEAASQIKGDSDQHTGDVYAWSATNTRAQNFNVNIRKVWRDDGTNQTQVPVRRPDIYFRMYRVPVNAVEGATNPGDAETKLMQMSSDQISQVRAEQVGNDYVWNTEHNNWYWSCDIDGEFARYDGNGNEYVYFGIEQINGGNEDYITEYYNGTTVPSTGAVPNTLGTFNPSDYQTYNNAKVLIIHKEGEGLQAKGSVINTKEDQFNAKTSKIWANMPANFDKTTLPTITMELYRKVKLDNSDQWVLCQTQDIENGGSGATFSPEQQYDAYGRKYEFKTVENYFVEDANGTYGKDAHGNYTTETSKWVANTKKYNDAGMISGYSSKASQTGNAFVWTNTYDENAKSEQRVEITVDKTWNFPNYTTELPKQVFELWRKGGGLTQDEKVSTSEITPDITQATKNENTSTKTLSVTFAFSNVDDNTSTKDYLPYYGANGQPYEYYVKEIIPGGYDASVRKTAGDTTIAGTKEAGDESAEVLESDVITLVIQAEQETTSNGKSRDVYKNTDSTKSWETAFTNTYTGKPEVTPVKAVKTWDDESNAYSTRPTDLVFTLYRTTNDTKDATNDEIVAVSTKKTDGWTKENDTWTYQFKNDAYNAEGRNANTNENYFDTYAPNGKKYTYYVVETSATDDTKFANYVLDTGDGKKLDSSDNATNNLNITNTLPTTEITAKKIWQGKDSSKNVSWIYDGSDAHPDSELENLFNMGAMPKSITFTLQYYDQVSNTAEWKNLQQNGKDVSYTATLSTIDDVKKLRDEGYTFTGLPKYIFDGNKQTVQEYRVVETATYIDKNNNETVLINGSAKDATSSTTIDGSFNYLSTQPSTDSSTVTTVTNQIELQKITLKKIWNDNDNKIGQRPSSVEFIVSAGNGSDDYTLERPQSEDVVNEWSLNVWVPKGAVSVKEKTDLSTYYTSTVSETTVTNTIKDVKIRTSITAEKSWSNGEHDFMNTVVQPTSIQLKLQYRYDGSNGWHDADAFCNVTSANELASSNTITVSADTTGKYSCTWDDLFMYYNASNTDQAKPITYRVVETTSAGYTVAYTYNSNTLDPDKEEGVVAKDAAESEKEGCEKYTSGIINVSNTIVANTSVTLHKQWADETLIKTALNGSLTGTDTLTTTANVEKLQGLGILPQALKFQLQYSKNSGTSWNNLDDYKEYKSAEELASILTAQTIYTDLPDKDAAGNTLIYRFKEVGVKFKNDSTYRDITSTSTDTLYSVTDPTTTSAITTNTVPNGKITVTKSVDDEENRDNTRGDIAVTLQRKTGSTYTDYATGVIKYENGSWTACTFNVPLYNCESWNNTDTKFAENEWKIVETSINGVALENSGYTATYTNQEISGLSSAAVQTKTVTIENKRTPDRFTASATKKWTDNASFSSETRPSTVPLKLQYQSGDNWLDVTEALSVTGTIQDFPNTQYSKDSMTYDYIYYNDRYYKWDTNKYVEDGTGVYTISAVTQNVKGSTTDTSISETATWEKLNVNSNGSKITYRVVESTVPKGYTVSYSKESFTSTNNTAVAVDVTNTLDDKARIILTKDWMDVSGNKKDTQNAYTQQMRPAKVEYLFEYSIDNGKNWKKVPKAILNDTEDGVYIVNCSNTDTDYQTFEFGCNGYQNPLLPIYASNGNRYLYRVTETKLIYSDNTEVSTKLAENWTINTDKTSFSKSGIAGAYDATITTTWNVDSDTTKPWNKFWKIQANNSLETVDVTATKTWTDDFNRDGLRKDITFKVDPQLKTDSTWSTSTQITNIENQTLKWLEATSVSWTALPKYSRTATAHDADNMFKYVVSETAPSGYTASYSQSDPVASDTTETSAVTNTHLIDTMEITATKAWDDYLDSLGSRPTSIQFKLQYTTVDNPQDSDWKDVNTTDQMNGVDAYVVSGAVTQTISPPTSGEKDADWSTATWKVPANFNVHVNDVLSANSKPLKYRVLETVNGYTRVATAVFIKTDNNDTTVTTETITNKLDTTELVFKKNWADEGSYAGSVRPTSVTYQIEYNKVDGNADAWKVLPSGLDGSTTGSGDTLKVTGVATSDGATLVKDGQFTLATAATATSETITLQGLPVKASDGKQYVYRISEVSLNYPNNVTVAVNTTSQSWDPITGSTKSSWSGATIGTYSITGTTEYKDDKWQAELTNTMVKTTHTVTKAWADDHNRDGYRDNINFELYRDGTSTTNILTNSQKTVTPVSQDAAQTVTWTGLPMYKNDAAAHTDANKSEYTAKETYITTNNKINGQYSMNPADGTANAITNTHNVEKLTITATKAWEGDNNDALGSRPENVYFKLQYTTDDNPGANTTWNDVKLSKDLTDAEKADGVTPYLMGDGDTTVKTLTRPNTLGAAWPSVTWTVPANKYVATNTCKPLKYRVVETDSTGTITTITGYTKSDGTVVNRGNTQSSNTAETTTITNTLVTTEVALNKTWANDTKYTAMRPDSITYLLEYSTDGTNWSKLPKGFDDQITGEATSDTKGQFTVALSNKAGGSTTITGLPLQKSDVAGTKYLYRVSEISMKYGSDTVAVYGSEWQTLVTSSNTSNFVQTDDSNNSVTTIGAYTITTGRTSWDTTDSENPKWVTNITNTLDTVDVTAKKEWDDEANRDNLRTTMTFHLEPQTLRDGTYTKSTDFTVEDETTGKTLAADANPLQVEWKALPKYQKFAANHEADYLYYYQVTEDEIKNSAGTKIYDSTVSPENIAYTAANNGQLAVDVTNSYTPERFTATATKIWNDYNDVMGTRPTDVSLTLQYKVGENGTWTDVVTASEKITMPESVSGTDPIYCGGKYYRVESGKYVPDGTTAYTTSEVTQKVKGNSTSTASDTATWNNLSVKSDGTQITYRVVENEPSENGDSVKVNGYLDPVIVGTTNADNTTIDTFKGTNNTQTAVTVTNAIDTIPLNLTKTWANDKSDNGDFRGMRPDALIYQVEYALKPTNDNDTVSWSNLPDGILAKVGTTTNVEVLNADAGSNNIGRFKVMIDKTSANDDAKDEVSLTGLPYQNSEGTQYLYRVSEIAAVFDETTVNADLAQANTYTIGGYKITVAETAYSKPQEGQTGNGSWNASFTNTLETVSLETTKTWLDNNNRDNTRVDLEFDVAVKLDNAECNHFTVPSKELKTTDDTYTVTWTGLPKYDRTTASWNGTNAKTYTYIVSEKNTSTATDDAITKFNQYQKDIGAPTFDTTSNKWTINVTNTLDSIDVFKIKADKEWADSFTASNSSVWSNATDKSDRPNSVKFTLQYLDTSSTTSEWKSVVKADIPANATVLPTTKASDIIFWGGRYFKWEANATVTNGGKYVEADGVYTTSDIQQTINKVLDKDTWSNSTWDNLPVSAKGQVISYRVIESSSGIANCYFSKRQHEKIQGNDTNLVKDESDKKVAATKITNKLTKLKLVKKDTAGEKLENVSFKIQQVKNAQGNEVTSAQEFTGITNSSGEVEFVGLESGTYKVTELQTTQGYQLLSAPFEVTLPMNMSETDITAWDNAHTDAAEKINKENAALSDDGTSWNFYQLTYTVTNTANFTMPMTGNSGTWYPGFLAFIPIMAAYILYRRKKKYNRA